MSKNGFHSKHLCKYNVTYLYSIDCTQNQIPKSRPTHKRENLDFILVGSDAKTQTRFNTSITLWPITFHHLTQRKKCDSITSSSRRIYLVLLSTIRKHPKMPNTAVKPRDPEKFFLIPSIRVIPSCEIWKLNVSVRYYIKPFYLRQSLCCHSRKRAKKVSVWDKTLLMKF